MKNRITASASAILPAAVLLLGIATSDADSATWNVNPGSGDWNSAKNWTPMTVPNGPNDTATFQASNQLNVFVSANTEVNAIVFNPDARNFSLTIQSSSILTISGAGITNNSGFTEGIQSSNGGGGMAFINSANAGDFISFSIGQNSTLTFSDSASAGGASFVNYDNSTTSFHDSSTAGNAMLLNSTPQNTNFYDLSTAGHATMHGASFHDSSTAGTAIVGRFVSVGSVAFYDSSTAGSVGVTGSAIFADNSAAMTAHLTAVGGSIVFSGNATGDMARVSMFDPSTLDISGHAAPGVTIGSLESVGASNVTLGTNRLTVGTNNMDTTFFGHIQDSPGGGSVDKIGTGTLIFSNSNTYNATIIEQGTLRATHDGAFGTSAQSGSYVSVEGNGILTLDNGTTNDYISDKANLKIVTGSIVNLNFSGASDRIRSLLLNGISQPPGIYGGPMSGAPYQLPQFTGTGTVIATTKAVSRKIHGAAGPFDIDLPLTGTPGIECRDGGGSSDYQIVVTFFNNVTLGSATVISGTGFVSSRSGDGTNTATINLSNVANAQTINTALIDVNDGTSTTTFVVPMSVLIGDVTGNGVVNGSDITLVKHTSQTVDTSNFRADVLPNGVLNSSDVSTVKFYSGTPLP